MRFLSRFLTPRHVTPCLAAMTLTVAAAAQAPYVVKDLNTAVRGTYGSEPLRFLVVGTKVYFQANSQPFVYDLTTNEPEELKPGGASVTTAGEITAAWGKVYFLARYQSKSWLCSTDGTRDGTNFLTEVGFSIVGPVAAGNKLFFSAQFSRGFELYAWDGNSLSLVKDIHPDGSSTPFDLTPSGPLLFFTADDGTCGRELWVTDGTTDGTRLVKDINPGKESSEPEYLTSRFDPRTRTHTLLFSALTSSGKEPSGKEPWYCIGKASNLTTNLLRDINPGSDSSIPEAFYYDPARKQFFFSADDGRSGHELWRTDFGSLKSRGAVLVKDINEEGASDPFPVASLGDKLLLVADDGVHGRELWVHTSGDTKMVRDLRPGSDWGVHYTPGAVSATSQGARLFFRSRSSSWSTQLWISDGTDSGTMLVKDTSPVASSIYGITAVPSGGIVFGCSDGIHGREPWFSDGTMAGTKMLVDLNTTPLPQVTHDANPRAGISRLDSVWFAASDATGDHVWQSVGTAEGTVLVPGISASSGVQDLTQLESGVVVWTALDAFGQRRLAGLDANGKSVFLSTPTNVGNLTAVGDRLYFTADDPTNGNELWTSLGTTQTTHLVRDIKSGAVGSSPEHLVAFRGEVYFIAASGLWRSNGTGTGTVKLASYAFGPLVAAGDYLYFKLRDFSSTGVGRELWKTDGTTTGTTLVKDINPGTADASPVPLAALGDTLLFMASEPIHGRELWKTDGTAKGTVLVKDLRPGVTNAFIQNATTIGDRVFFSGRTVQGLEPWVSDGTTAGTYMLKDIDVGLPSSNPGPFVGTRKGDIWFAATSTEYGRELWRTDGTIAGTTLVADLVPGPYSSDPEVLGLAESDKPRLLLAATDWRKGRELFAIDLPSAMRTIGQGCAYQAQPPTLYVDPSMTPLFTIAAFGGRHVRPNSSVFLLVSPKPAVPLPFSACSLYIDGSFVVLERYQVTTGSWKDSALVKFDTSHVGLTTVWQAATWPSPGPVGMDLTNGVITTFGR